LTEASQWQAAIGYWLKAGKQALGPAYPRSLALAHTRLGQQSVALQLLDEALRRIEKTEIRHAESEIRQLRAEVLFAVRSEEEAAVEMECALAVARTQASRRWELRAAISLARRWCDHGHRAEARTLLAPVYDWFTEGFDLLALRNAKALLNRVIA